MIAALLGRARARARAAAQALAAARASMPALDPDGWAGDRPFLSAALVEAEGSRQLAAHGLEVHLIDVELAQVGMVTVARSRFCWRSSAWTSEPTRIDVQLDTELPITGRTTAAITTARKIYVSSLLGIRQAPDIEGALNRATEAAHSSVRAATRSLLRTYARKANRAESAIIRMALPSRARQLEAPTFAELAHFEIAALAWWLLTQVGDASTFVEGELPSRTIDRADAPDWMGEL